MIVRLATPMQDYVSCLLDYRVRRRISTENHFSKLARLNNLLADHNKTFPDIRS